MSNFNDHFSRISRVAEASRPAEERPACEAQPSVPAMRVSMPALRGQPQGNARTFPAAPKSMPVMARPRSARTVNVVIALDISSSMEGSKMSAACQAATDLADTIGSMPGQEKFKIALVEFGDQARTLVGFRPIDAFASAGPLGMKASAGGTNIAAGFDVSAHELSTQCRADKAMGLRPQGICILLSDGEHNTCGNATVSAEKLRAAGHTVATIAFGHDANKAALQGMATPGLNFAVYNSQSLRQLFLRLGATLSQAAASGTPMQTALATI